MTLYRKVAGEGKGEAHGEGGGVFDGSSVPMRRWEDWERSRLRKIKREERRRREMERAFPRGYDADGNRLNVRSEVFSQYDGSDTVSLASSDEDQWGPQIGAYNENSTAYPPPPTGVLLPRNELLASADTVGASDLEAMLERGFDSNRSSPGPGSSNPSSQNLLQNSSSQNLPRYQLSDSAPKPRFDAYSGSGNGNGGYMPVPPRNVVSPVSPTVPTNGASSAIGVMQTHARRRSGGGGRSGSGPNGYGPLGPLDPGGGRI